MPNEDLTLVAGFRRHRMAVNRLRMLADMIKVEASRIDKPWEEIWPAAKIIAEELRLLTAQMEMFGRELETKKPAP